MVRVLQFAIAIITPVLLVAMIGAIVLAHRVRTGVRKQSIAAQVSRTRAEAVELKKVKTGDGI